MNAEAIKIGFAVLAGAFTFFLYLASVDDKRIERVLTYAKALEKGDIAEANRTLTLYWLDPRQHNLLLHRNDTKETRRKFFEEAAKVVRNNRDFQKYVLILHSYFSDIVVCTRQDLCQKETACEIFGQTIRDFYVTYYDPLEHWDKVLQSTRVLDPLIKFGLECEDLDNPPWQPIISAFANDRAPGNKKK